MFHGTFISKFQYRCSMGHLCLKPGRQDVPWDIHFEARQAGYLMGNLFSKPGRQDIPWDICFWSQAGGMFHGTSIFEARQAGCSMGHLVLKPGRQDIPWDINFEASIQRFHGTSVFKARHAGCSTGHVFWRPGRVFQGKFCLTPQDLGVPGNNFWSQQPWSKGFYLIIWSQTSWNHGFNQGRSLWPNVTIDFAYS